MKVIDAREKLKNIKDLHDFQDAFFYEDIDGKMIADFETVYKTPNGGYTTNRSAATYDRAGQCTNVYMKLEDGFLLNPF